MKSAMTRRHRQHAGRVRYPETNAQSSVYCAHSSSAFRSPRKNASASPAKWREPVIKTRSLLRCAAEIASATDGVMEWGSDGVLKEKMDARSCGGNARSLQIRGNKNFDAIGRRASMIAAAFLSRKIASKIIACSSPNSSRQVCARILALAGL